MFQSDLALVLVCTHPVTRKYTWEKVTTVGAEYPVFKADNNHYHIHDDNGYPHVFTVSEDEEDNYRNWFRMKND